jgi:thioesterase domain-containing protein
LSQAMGLTVSIATPDRVRLTAPLAPNINHRATAFGGSVSALGILAAWTLLYLRLDAAKLAARLVIQNNSMRYDSPITGTFHAEAALRDPGDWDKFVRTLQRKDRARIHAVATLSCNNVTVGEFAGDFVALSGV